MQFWFLAQKLVFNLLWGVVAHFPREECVLRRLYVGAVLALGQHCAHVVALAVSLRLE